LNCIARSLLLFYPPHFSISVAAFKRCVVFFRSFRYLLAAPVYLGLMKMFVRADHLKKVRSASPSLPAAERRMRSEPDDDPE